MAFNVVSNILIILMVALAATIVLRFLKTPIILGYIVVGVIVGPHALAWLGNTSAIQSLAEFGVVLLMFTVGLEFSLSELYVLRFRVFVLGGLQVLLSIIITIFIGWLLGMSVITALIMGGIVAMSSTAIVSKQLTEQGELNTPYGLNAISILLFQDLAVIPLLVIVASFSVIHTQPLWLTLLSAFGKGLIAIVVILAIGQWLLKPLFRLIALARVIELFTLSVLTVAIGCAWLTHSLGLSYALGAFFAGILLAECEYKEQIKLEIRPFRDILLGLFFITIGMLVNLEEWANIWPWILLLFIGLVIGKMLLVILLTRAARYSLLTAVRSGLILGQGGEFGFAILSLALTKALFPLDWGQAILAALLLSFIITPLVIRYHNAITARLLPRHSQKALGKMTAAIKDQVTAAEEPIIICGYGRVGQNIAAFLKKINYPYLGLDIDQRIVDHAKLAGDKVVYADATHPHTLQATQLQHARAIVITFNELRASLAALGHIKKIANQIPIIVRTQDELSQQQLKRRGANIIVTEIFEESLTLAHHVMKLLAVPHTKIVELLQAVRDDNYCLLDQTFPGSHEQQNWQHPHLQPIVLNTGAYALGHTLAELGLTHQHADIISIQRAQQRLPAPLDQILLQAGDVVVLYGSPNQLTTTEKILLEGLG